VLAHSDIGHVDFKGMIPLPDYGAMNAAVGHIVAFLIQTKNRSLTSTMPLPMALVNSADADVAYKAFWEFKDVVAALQR